MISTCMYIYIYIYNIVLVSFHRQHFPFPRSGFKQFLRVRAQALLLFRNAVKLNLLFNIRTSLWKLYQVWLLTIVCLCVKNFKIFVWSKHPSAGLIVANSSAGQSCFANNLSFSYDRGSFRSISWCRKRQISAKSHQSLIRMKLTVLLAVSVCTDWCSKLSFVKKHCGSRHIYCFIIVFHVS